MYIQSVMAQQLDYILPACGSWKKFEAVLFLLCTMDVTKYFWASFS